MSLKTAFTTAWKDFKSTLTRVNTFLIADAPKIQGDIQVGIGVASALDPALAPALTAGDEIEESAIGELLSIFSSGSAVVNATTGAAAVTLSSGLATSLTALVGTLENHPAVIAANAVPIRGI